MYIITRNLAIASEPAKLLDSIQIRIVAAFSIRESIRIEISDLQVSTIANMSHIYII